MARAAAAILRLRPQVVLGTGAFVSGPVVLAAAALGRIGSAEAAKALGAFQAKAPKELRAAAADAYLCCAESLLADGKKMQATVIYKALNTPDQPKHVQLAAKRGLLAAMGKK